VETRPTALEFLRRLWSLDNALDSGSKRMIRELGISGPQRVVLRLVTEAGEIGPTEIADQMMHHPATVSSLLKRLEDGGYIERRESAIDRRRTVVVATERGRELGSRTEGTIEARVASFLAGQDPADIDRCMRVLSALVKELVDPVEP
jgi:DNA-binding MarR family transcriptional regulator